MRSVTLPAYAKLNLHLQVLGKRPDGYHELLTLFERVTLADELCVEETGGADLELQCESEEVPHDGTNLAIRAAELFREASGWRSGLRIRLTKRIPVGGGLGGGSSDAAAVLLALQELSGGVLKPDALLGCARQLGADVSFFAARASRALGRARGDEIEPVPAPGPLWYLLVTPGFSVPTQQVYQALGSPSTGLRAGLTPPAPDVMLLLRALDERSPSQVREFLFNALEPTVEALYPELRDVKDVMRKTGGLLSPCISGSGSTVFAVCDSEAQARSAGERIRRERPGWRLTVARTI